MSAAGMLMAACCCKKGQVCNCPRRTVVLAVTLAVGDICCAGDGSTGGGSVTRGFTEISATETVTFEPPEWPICYPLGGITKTLSVDGEVNSFAISPGGTCEDPGTFNGLISSVGAGVAVTLECAEGEAPKWTVNFQAGSGLGPMQLVTNPPVVITGDSPASSGTIGIAEPGPNCNELGNAPAKYPDLSASYSITDVGGRSARGVAGASTRVVTRHTLTRESGPALWHELHTFAKRFAGDVNAALLFLTRLAWRLPGGCNCIRTYQQWLMTHPPALDSAAAFFRWTWELHNDRNAFLGKPLMALADADALYPGEEV